MKTTRIDRICHAIKKKNCIVVDIGSDHAFLAIKLLKNKIAKFIYNVEINKKPLNQTIKNLTNHGLINKTKNILNDGLKNWKCDEQIDYACISGIGGNKIVYLIKNFPKNIKIANLIVIPNNNSDAVRKFLLKFKYRFIYEEIIKENGYYYPLIYVALNKKNKIKNNIQNQYFGPYNLLHPSNNFINMLKERKNYLNKNSLTKYNKNLNKEYKLIDQYLKKYNLHK